MYISQPPGCRIPWFDAMVRAQLAREDTLVVTARDKGEAALLGLAVFTIESRSGSLGQHLSIVRLQQFARVNIFPAASLSVSTAACLGRRRGRRGSPSTA